MTTAQEVFDRHFPGLTPEELDAALRSRPAGGTAPVSDAAMAYLAEHGGDEARAAVAEHDPEQAGRDRAVAAARALEETVRSALTIEEAAVRLGVSRSRVSHRLAAQTLYAFTVAGRRHLPRWQFTDGGEPLSGLAIVVPAIPRDVHPLSLDAFMTTPLEDLDGHSPVSHLASGGSPGVVAEWLESLGHA